MKPRVQAILIADHVYEDKSTGKKIVAGIFDRLFFINRQQLQQQIDAQLEEKGIEGSERRVPGGLSAGSPTCYINITDIRGRQHFLLRYVYVDEEQLMFKTEFDIEGNDPLKRYELVFPLPPLPSDKPGTFALELVCNDDMIGSHRITVEELPFQENSS